MKSQKDFRTQPNVSADTLKKAVKLEPIRKSGKEKHTMFKGLENDQDEDELEYQSLKKRESVLDYMGDDDEEEDEDQLDKWDDDQDDEDWDDENDPNY